MSVAVLCFRSLLLWLYYMYPWSYCILVLFCTMSLFLYVLCLLASVCMSASLWFVSLLHVIDVVC